MKNSLLSNRLVVKLLLAFLSILLLAGIGYMVSALYMSNNYFYETTQRLHANLAQDLIDEKFKDERPFDEEGEVNKLILHQNGRDMPAPKQAASK